MPIPRFSTKFSLLIAMLLIGSMTGCVPWARGIRSLEDTVTDWRDFVWGKRAFYQRYGNDKSSPFRDGFLEGYHEILQGGDGCLPVVPPKRYWSWRYQSAGGQAAVSDWFNGFSAGVAAAKEDGLNGLSCVPLSYQYNGASDVPIEAMPMDGANPIEQLEPGQTPKPSVEPPSPPAGKTTMMYFPANSGIQPATANQPLSRSIPVISSPLPMGSGTVQVTPMGYASPATAPQLPDTTSRRGGDAPYSYGRMPVLQPPSNYSAGSSSSSSVPLPYRR